MTQRLDRTPAGPRFTIFNIPHLLPAAGWKDGIFAAELAPITIAEAA